MASDDIEMADIDNSREFIRSNISIAARLTPAGAPAFDVIVIDLSLHGILMQTEQHLDVGCKCSVVMLIGHYMHELPISAEGVVVRSQGDMIAVCFDAVGIESSEELQSMILFHSNDPEQCLQEFKQIEAG